ncbi:MAG: 4-hydroxythreonine-4-phosphate dehydrogenase PdxA [Flavobacteriales bacterium]
MSKHKKIRVGITSGDVNGIGLEVTLKALSDARVYEHCVPVIYASKKCVNFQMKTLGLEGLHFHTAADIDKIDFNKINVLDIWKSEPYIEFGQVTKDAGQCAFESLETAVKDIASNKIDVIVTAPINKANIQSESFQFPGHTEYLANYANEENPLMILFHDNLRVALVSGHIPLKEIASSLSRDKILNKLRAFSKSLMQDFGINRPRIAVLGLNPHSGDNGLLGDEESITIRPAIETAIAEGILAFGPYPADGLFGSAQRNQFDGILAMYHDQGLAPFKALSFDAGVNFTAGLPIVRTSPDHGTAYDIAGKGLAEATSMRNAIFAACDIYNQRREYRDLVANVLEINVQKGKD